MARRRCSWNPFDNKAVIRSWRTPHRTPRSGVTAEQYLRRVQGEGGGTRLLDVAQIRADLDGCRSEARLVSPVRLGLLDNSLKIGALRSGVTGLKLPRLPISLYPSAPQIDFEHACGRAPLPIDDDPERVEQRRSPGSNRGGFLGAGHRRCHRLVRDGGDGRHRAAGGGDVSRQAAGGAPADSVSGASGDGGSGVPGLPDAVRRRRAAAAAGDVSGLRGGRPCPLGHQGTGRTAPVAIRSAASPEGEAVTLRFIAARILRDGS